MPSDILSPPATLTETLIDTDSIAAACGVSSQTIARWNASGNKMPKGIKLGRKILRWRASDISRWLQLGCPNRRDFEAQTVGK